MGNFLTRLMLCAAFVLAAASPVRMQAQEETLAVIVHPGANVSRMSADELEAVFTLSKRQWSGGQSIIVFNLPSQTNLRESFDEIVLGMNADEVGHFWIDQRIRGKGEAPTKVPTPALMVQVVAKLPGSIGYVPLSTVTPHVRVVARISGGKVLPP
jgi:ABC-type phosphate transport system substrate-binding protein